MALSALSRVLGWPDGVVETIGGESTLCLLARMLQSYCVLSTDVITI